MENTSRLNKTNEMSGSVSSRLVSSRSNAFTIGGGSSHRHRYRRSLLWPQSIKLNLKYKVGFDQSVSNDHHHRVCVLFLIFFLAWKRVAKPPTKVAVAREEPEEHSSG